MTSLHFDNNQIESLIISPEFSVETANRLKWLLASGWMYIPAPYDALRRQALQYIMQFRVLSRILLGWNTITGFIVPLVEAVESTMQACSSYSKYVEDNVSVPCRLRLGVKGTVYFRYIVQEYQIGILEGTNKHANAWNLSASSGVRGYVLVRIYIAFRTVAEWIWW